MQEEGYFTSVGSLYITLIEALDLLPPAATKSIWTRKVKQLSSSFANVAIFDASEKDSFRGSRRTAIVPYHYNETFSFGEDFTFENVPSSCTLSVSVFTLTRGQGSTSCRCLGTMKIPLGRLEENHVITQWYQLVDPTSDEGSKCVLRMKALFVTDNSSRGITLDRKDSVRVPMAPNIERHYSRHNISFINNTLKSSDDEGLGPSEVVLMNRKDSAMSNFSAFSTSFHDNKMNGLSPMPSLDTFRLGLGRRSSLNLDPTLTSGDYCLDDEKVVPAGLIDYCVVLGPRSPYSLDVTHALTDNGGYRRVPFSGRRKALAAEYSPIGDPNALNTGLLTSSTMASNFLPIDAADVVIWDRVPSQDLKEMELPSKVEWFACPEGPITVEAAERPEPLLSTFLLNSGNENHEVFGAALHFFVLIDLDHDDNNYCEDVEDSLERDESPVWWASDNTSTNETKAARKVSKMRNWTAITLAFLFRIEFFDEISRCLLYYYNANVKSSIEHWEDRRKTYLQAYFESHGDHLPDDVFEIQKLELLRAIPPCHTMMESFITLLRFGCPTPISDLLSISIEFRKPASSHKERVLFEAKASDVLPSSPDSLGFILQNFGPKVMLNIFCCVLSECRILFHSRNIGHLRKICGGFRNLTYPLFWAHVYLPVVPIHLLNLVEAPVPFLLGVHTDSLSFINLEYISDIVVVDCDSGAITMNASTNLTLPEKDDRWMTESLSLLLIPHSVWNDTLPTEDDDYQQESANRPGDSLSLDQKVQLIFFDFMLHLLRFVPDCLFYLNPNFPLFNRQLFLSEYSDEDYRQMLSLLTVTNAFHSFTETLHTPAMQYFYRTVDQIAAAETQIINESRKSSAADITGGSPRRSDNHLAKNKGAGSPNKAYLSRQVSVRSIVLDKIALTTTPVPLGRQASVTSNNSESGLGRSGSTYRMNPFSRQSTVDSGFDSMIATPGGLTSKSSLFRLKSAMFMDTGKGSPTVGGMVSPKLNSMSFFAIDMITLRYAEIYPSWLFQAQGSLAKDRFVHTQDIVESRFKYHSKIRRQIAKKRRRVWRKYIVHIGVEEAVEAAEQAREVDIDIEGVLDSIPKSAELPLTLINPDGHTLVKFDPEVLADSEAGSIDWTISHLASTLRIDVEELRKQIEDRLDDQNQLPTTPSVAAPSTPGKPGQLNGTQFRRNSIAANKLQKPTQQMMDKIALKNQSLDPALAEFFQKTILSDTMNDHVVEEALPRCEIELKESKNRDTLVVTLKHAKRERGRHETAAPIYLLNDASFEAFAALFTCMLRICSDEEDYVNANGLLEVGAYYCRKLPDEVIQNMIEMNEEEQDFFEFLSEKIYQHPIYQNPNFWKKQLMQRMATSSRFSGSAEKDSPTRLPFPIIMTEVKSLLLNMNGMKVNSARSLAFIQGVAADYRLSIDEYYQMQRYAMSLWESHLAAAGANEMGLIPSEDSKLIKRTASISNARTRSRDNSILFRDNKQSHNSSTYSVAHRVNSVTHMDDSFYYQEKGNGSTSMLPEVYSNGGTPNAAIATLGGNDNVQRSNHARAALTVHGASSSSSMDLSASVVMAPDSPPLSPNRGVPRTRTRSRRGSTSNSSSQNNIKASPSSDVDEFGAINVHVDNDSLRMSTDSIDDEDDDDYFPTSHNSSMILPLVTSPPPPAPSTGASVTPRRSSAPSLLTTGNSNTVAMRSPSNATSSSPSLAAALFPTAKAGTPLASGGNGGNLGMWGTSQVSTPASTIGIAAFGVSEDVTPRTPATGSTLSPTKIHRSPSWSATKVSPLPPTQKATLLSKVKPLEVKGLETTMVQSYASVSNWLLVGDDDGYVTVADLHSASVVVKTKHGSSSDDRYRGVTAIQAMPAPCTASNEYVAFTGCSEGTIKVWMLPNQNQSHSPDLSPSPNTSGKQQQRKSLGWISSTTSADSSVADRIRLKQSSQVTKQHSARITCLSGELYSSPSSASMGWILAAGDAAGDCSVLRSTPGAEILTTKMQVHAPSNSVTRTSLSGANAANATPAPIMSHQNYPLLQDHISVLTFFSGGSGMNSTVIDVVKQFNSNSSSGGGSRGINGAQSVDPLLALGTASGHVAVVDINVGHSIFSVEGHAARVSKILPVKQNVFLTAGYDRMMKMWDIRMRTAISTTMNVVSTNKSLATFKPYEERPLGGYLMKRCATAAISEVAVGGWDSSLLISASADGEIRLWDLKYDLHNPCTTIAGHSDRITGILWNSQEEFHTASYDGTICSWDSIHAKCSSRLQVFEHQPAVGYTEGILQMQMTDFYHRVSSVSPSVSTANSGTAGDGVASSQRMVLHRQCVLASGWMGKLKVFAHDHFLQSDKA